MIRNSLFFSVKFGASEERCAEEFPVRSIARLDRDNRAHQTPVPGTSAFAGGHGHSCRQANAAKGHDFIE